MLLLNEILEKGFDGQNIITGLANHFRDLLVCKDEATLVLFEVGASMRARYMTTANQCSDKSLFKAIELSNQCDLNYRNSRNKRLLLELTLIQLCQQIISPDEEGDKKKTLIAPINPTKEKSKLQSTNSTSVNTSAVTTSYTPPVIMARSTESEPAKISPMRTTSLKELTKEKENKNNSPLTSQTSDTNSDFSQDDLIKHWTEYANSLTAEKIHLKNTLISCKPELKENFTFEVSIYNPSQKDEIISSSTDILGYLSSKLNNSQIKMDIHIVEKDETVMIYTSSEKYDYLSKKNPNLEKLKEHFNLIPE